MPASQLFATIAAIGLLATPAFAKPAASPGLKQQFQALYSKMDNATRHYDLAGFLSVYDSQLIEHPLGQPTEYIAEYKQGFASTFQVQKFLNPVTTVQSIKP